MSSLQQLAEGVLYVGVMDWNRRLFDALIPLPDGTSYNAYLVKGTEKTALIDTVDPAVTDTLFSNLEKAGVQQLDYVVANHAEQDHSGTIPALLQRFSSAQVICSAKCKPMLLQLLGMSEDRIMVVDDGQELSLGGKTLRFVYAPWVHWPETMLTYLVEDRILFPCDLFGSHLATSRLFCDDDPVVYEAAKRYYAEIMMPFKKLIRQHLEKIAALELGLIAPSHGPIYRKPEFILEAYRDWVSPQVKNQVVLPYVSMHGSTQKMVDYFVDALVDRGIEVFPFELTTSDLGKLAIALVDAATVVFATPMLLGGAHPHVVSAAYLASVLKPKVRFASVIGSYSWGGNMVDQIKDILKGLKPEWLEPVLTKGLPTEETFAALDRLADAIREKHAEAC